MAAFISFAPRAERDYRNLISNQASRKQVDKALDGLMVGAANLNIKAVSGRPPWLRMRAGDHRVLYRPLTGDERRSGGVGIVHEDRGAKDVVDPAGGDQVIPGPLCMLCAAGHG